MAPLCPSNPLSQHLADWFFFFLRPSLLHYSDYQRDESKKLCIIYARQSREWKWRTRVRSRSVLQDQAFKRQSTLSGRNDWIPSARNLLHVRQAGTMREIGVFTFCNADLCLWRLIIHLLLQPAQLQRSHSAGILNRPCSTDTSYLQTSPPPVSF